MREQLPYIVTPPARLFTCGCGTLGHPPLLQHEDDATRPVSRHFGPTQSPTANKTPLPATGLSQESNQHATLTLGGASRTRSASGRWSLVNGLTSTAGRCLVSVMSSMFTIPERAMSHGSWDAYNSRPRGKNAHTPGQNQADQHGFREISLLLRLAGILLCASAGWCAPVVPSVTC